MELDVRQNSLAISDDRKLINGNSVDISKNTVTAASTNEYLMHNSLVFH